MNPFDLALAFAMLFAAGGGVYVAVMVAQAVVARRLPPADADASEISRLREDVQRLTGDVADMHQVVGELLERVDFAERLLAKEKQQPALPEG